jgi:hypothetical protein
VKSEKVCSDLPQLPGTDGDCGKLGPGHKGQDNTCGEAVGAPNTTEDKCSELLSQINPPKTVILALVARTHGSAGWGLRHSVLGFECGI